MLSFLPLFFIFLLVSSLLEWNPNLLVVDLEWKLVYVGCAEDEKYDQDLETVFVGPVNVGSYRFVFQVRII